MNPPGISSSPLLNPTALPLRSVSTIAGSALVVAPHPDDETLGCGGAIALLRASGYSVHILVISDGTLSHPRSLKYPAPRLQALREAETLAALSVLGVSPTEATFLRLKDGSVPADVSNGFQAAITHCLACLNTRMPNTLFLPWRADPHPDHRATWQIVRAAVDNLTYSPRILEYPIWDWDLKQQGELANFEQVVGWRLDIEAVLETKQQAIAAYRSQTTNLIDDDPDGFQLTPEMLANFARPWEMYLENVQ
ncbi:PIG-L family deacetylase [Oculatella sp. LEGE 06141]|uniref:PIG-L deacetylase family protein n=1 Tax=Oculatella sp. LEGE 06141 TaxID=1828648 RepID=UPI00188036A2|nr:PIG-L deacetylase family protein [Oculatella sp. LEGE 06141]MBE9179581.1 PIG-L family deacetylase [Oculatella sp. LEGE 06141]